MESSSRYIGKSAAPTERTGGQKTMSILRVSKQVALVTFFLVVTLLASSCARQARPAPRQVQQQSMPAPSPPEEPSD